VAAETLVKLCQIDPHSIIGSECGVELAKDEYDCLIDLEALILFLKMILM
jgi:hypothetical protein